MMIMNTVNNGKLWRQPIPCAEELERIFQGDYRCMQLYIQLIYRACNKDNSVIHLKVNVSGVERIKTATLMRGQVLYGRHKFGKYLGWNSKTTDRALTKLTSNYQKLTIQRNHNWTIVTVLNYEELVGMSKQRPTSDQAVTTSYSVKSVQSEESEKNNGIPPVGVPQEYLSNLINKEENAGMANGRPDTYDIADMEMPPVIKGAVLYYKEKYKLLTGIEHPRLKGSQIEEIISGLSGCFDDDCSEVMGTELDSDNWINMINWHFFNSTKTDFNLNHFATKGILKNLYYDAVYNTRAETAMDKLEHNYEDLPESEIPF